MVLKNNVAHAFQTLGVATDVPLDVAKSAYRKLALKYHPDKNLNDSASTEKFQQVIAAWETLQQHYKNPTESQETVSVGGCHYGGGSAGYYNGDATTGFYGGGLGGYYGNGAGHCDDDWIKIFNVPPENVEYYRPLFEERLGFPHRP